MKVDGVGGLSCLAGQSRRARLLPFGRCPFSFFFFLLCNVFVLLRR